MGDYYQELQSSAELVLDLAREAGGPELSDDVEYAARLILNATELYRIRLDGGDDTEVLRKIRGK